MLKNLKPVKGKLPKNFVKAVDWLKRPYIRICEFEYQRLLKDKYDFYNYKGQIVTFGGADEGYALMPIRADIIKLHKLGM